MRRVWIIQRFSFYGDDIWYLTDNVSAHDTLEQVQEALKKIKDSGSWMGTHRHEINWVPYA